MTNTTSLRVLHRQSGFTLVEMLVAVAIGLFLMLGISQVFLASGATNRLQTAISLTQENGRFAIDMLSREINLAGFRTGAVPVQAFFSTNPAVCAVPPNNFTQDCDGMGDSIAVQYQSATDCLGQATGGTALNVYYVDDTDGDGRPSLMCRGNGGGNAEALVDGIEAMQILYGEHIDGVGTDTTEPTADVYRSAANVANWDNVVSVRLAVLAHSIDSVGSLDDDTYFLLDGAQVGPFNDTLRRQLYRGTAIRRNKQ